MSTSRSTVFLRTLGIAIALAIVVALAPASSGADKGDAPSRAAASSATPKARNAAKHFKGTTKSSLAGLSKLRATASAEGTVRVIVGFDAAPRARRAGIKGGRKALLADVAGTRHNVVRRFRSIPYVAMEVSPGALARLEASDEVTSIAEDRLSAPALAESSPLIQAPTMWAAGITGAGQTVAVLDSGTETGHSFLAGRTVAEACFSAASSCPDGSTSQTGVGAGAPCTYAPSACEHGTHVAGIALGASDAFSGVARGANLIPVQVFSEFTGADCTDAGEDPCALSFDSDQMKGLEYVYSQRTVYDIASVNMSLGGGQSYYTCDLGNEAYKAIIAKLRAADIATVIATGNNGFVDSISFPACLSNSVSVASTTKGDAVSDFSNNAYFTTLMAPGTEINSSVPGNGFDVFSGTSMATPHVAGAWALVKQANPDATVGEIVSAFTATGVMISDVEVGPKPRINVADASALVTAGAPKAEILQVSSSPNPFKANGKKKMKIFWQTPQYTPGFTIAIHKKSGKKLLTLAKGDMPIGSWFWKWNGKKGGKLVKAGRYKVILTATDDAGNKVKESSSFRLKR